MGINVAFDMRPAQLERRSFAVDAFTIRAEARAALVAAGEMSLHEAVDGLQEAAVGGELVEQIGQDEVQAIMAAAFGRTLAHARTMPDPEPSVVAIAEPPPPRRRELAASTIDVLKYVIRQRDPEQLRRFLARRPRDELRAMQRLMVANDRKN
jgi:hypothetical protein